MAEPIYRGFSSVANKGINTALFDLNLVVQDLLNEFQTRLGERVGRPTYGSIIHDLIFDLGDPRLESIITADVNRIIGTDPRVTLLEFIPVYSTDGHGITLNIRVRAIQFDIDTWFNVTFTQTLA